MRVDSPGDATRPLLGSQENALNRSTIALAGYSYKNDRRKLVTVAHERIVYPIRDGSPIKFRRSFFWILLVVLLILFGTRTAVSYYVDSLWFSSLGYAEIFWRTLTFKWTAFALPFALTFLILYGWFAVLRHASREELRSAGTIVLGSRTFELPVVPALRVGAFIASVFIALLAGASFMANGRVSLSTRFAPVPATADARDPIFGKSLSFYFFICRRCNSSPAGC